MKDKQIVIGISGKKQAGKDTLANYAKVLLGDVEICSFADALKECCISIMGLSHDSCYGSDNDKNMPTQYLWENLPTIITNKYGKIRGFMSAREILQIFGTDIMRNMFSQKIWVDATLRRINNIECSFVVIPDVRFVSEVNAIMGLENGYLIRLTRKVFEDSHPSETELDDFDFSQFGSRALVIDNQNIDIQEKNELARPFFMNIAESI